MSEILRSLDINRFEAFSSFILSNLHSQKSFPPPQDLSIDSTYFDGYRQHINVNTGGRIKLISFLAKHAENTAADSLFFNIAFRIPTELANQNIDGALLSKLTPRIPTARNSLQSLWGPK